MTRHPTPPTCESLSHSKGSAGAATGARGGSALRRGGMGGIAFASPDSTSAHLPSYPRRRHVFIHDPAPASLPYHPPLSCAVQSAAQFNTSQTAPTDGALPLLAAMTTLIHTRTHPPTHPPSHPPTHPPMPRQVTQDPSFHPILPLLCVQDVLDALDEIASLDYGKHRRKQSTPTTFCPMHVIASKTRGRTNKPGFSRQKGAK